MSFHKSSILILFGVGLFFLFQNCADYKAQTMDAEFSSSENSYTYAQDDYQISEEYEWARVIMQRVGGVSRGPEDPTIRRMMGHIIRGDARSAIDAATRSDGFYNVTMREIAAPMSNREENVAEPLNDFIATFIGVVRDDENAKQLLTGDYFYKASMTATDKQDEIADIIKSNTHYQEVDNQGLDLADAIERVENQRVMTQEGGVIDMPDAAGLITSRAFMKAHAFKGTNRRLVEHSFKEFLCSPITSWADIDTPDDRVGKDVDRFPVGDNSIFQNTCKACHGALDAYRPAFGHVDFAADPGNDQFAFLKYKFDTKLDPHPTNPGEFIAVPDNQKFVPSKMRRNLDVYHPGFLVTDEKWRNYNLGQDNIKRFGWRSPDEGEGLKEFGNLLAESKAFSRCMAKKIYKKVCRKDLPLVQSEILHTLAEQFENRRYNIRELTIMTALRPDCFGLNIEHFKNEEGE